MDILSTSDVLDRHLRAFNDYDVEALLADYASDAVFVVPTGLLRGSDAIKPFFEALVSECEAEQAALRVELVQRWSAHNTATVAGARQLMPSISKSSRRAHD